MLGIDKTFGISNHKYYEEKEEPVLVANFQIQVVDGEGAGRDSPPKYDHHRDWDLLPSSMVMSSIILGSGFCSGSLVAIFAHVILFPFQRPGEKSKSEPQHGDIVVHLAKVGSNLATCHGKLNQKTKSNVATDGSHNSRFQTLLLSRRDEHIFKNKII